VAGKKNKLLLDLLPPSLPPFPKGLGLMVGVKGGHMAIKRKREEEEEGGREIMGLNTCTSKGFVPSLPHFLFPSSF